MERREKERRGRTDRGRGGAPGTGAHPTLLTHHTPRATRSFHSNNEISFTGAFGEKGTRTTLTVPAGATDILSRQLVKAETATATVPELEFEIPAGTQKGCITTVEGLLREAADKLRALQPERKEAHPEAGAAIDVFLGKLDEAAAGGLAFSLVLDDPAGNSGVESAGPSDPLVKVAHYERTREQAAACGLKVGEVSGGGRWRERACAGRGEG